jgi:hypothetical protein
MSDLEILFWVVQACVALWCAYQLGYHIGRVNGINSAMGFVDTELKRLKKILEDCTTK